MTYSLTQRLVAEALGTAFLLAIVVGSGIMGDALSSDDAVALLGNTIATGAGLVVLIMIFGPVSGAHFNPAVTLSFLFQRKISAPAAVSYVVVQIIGAFVGVWAAHFMFDIELLQSSSKIREGAPQIFSEGVATVALVLTIIGTLRTRPDAVPYMVGLVITAGYWFTSSTSFANPAVTLARSASDTFAGIASSGIIGFIVVQLVGAMIATVLGTWLFSAQKSDRVIEGSVEGVLVDVPTR